VLYATWPKKNRLSDLQVREVKMPILSMDFHVQQHHQPISTQEMMEPCHVHPFFQIPEPEPHTPASAEVDVNVTPGQAPERIVLFQAI
jgi:hypothetical protein